MCLIAFAWQVHPDYPLVLVANRDEFHDRPSAPLGFWASAPELCAGRDLREGGTWLGLHRAGRLAAVTNVRQPAPAVGQYRSRGSLSVNFLQGSSSAADYAAGLVPQAAQYGGYNLLLWDGAELVYASNQPQPSHDRVTPGLHGLSNARLDTPWPKVCRLRGALEQWLTQPGAGDEALLKALADPQAAADAELPDTGVGLTLERALSSPFIQMPGYGTRCSSLVRVDRRGRVQFLERRYDASGAISGECEELFTLHHPPAA